MANIESILKTVGIIPVIKIDNPETAVPMAKALIKGGINAAEITFRTSAAAKAIERISSELPEMFVCAGTVLNTEQANLAVMCGAKAVISPGTNPEVVKWCNDNNTPIFPGCATPTEIESAMSMGLTTVKLFPAEVVGGISMLKALYGPYRGIKFMPTGGITTKNVEEYLGLPNVIACGGTWICAEDLLASENYTAIEENAREASKIVARLRGSTAGADIDSSTKSGAYLCGRIN